MTDPTIGTRTEDRPPVASPAEDLRHPALSAADPGQPLAEARLTDRQRLALLLQGAALLGHLERAGWRPPVSWEGAGVSAGLLRLPGTSPGRGRRLPQESLQALAVALFGGGAVAGRGEARRAVRVLSDRWAQALAPIGPDELVALVLEEAAFLWLPPFATARTALAAEIRRGGEAERWVVGPASFRDRLLAGEPTLVELAQRLASPAAREAWRGAVDGDPVALVRQGRARAAAAAWSERPPTAAGERLLAAETWYRLGRFERAFAEAADLAGGEAALLRIRCQLALGRLGAARRALRRLAEGSPGGEEIVAAAELGVRAFANSGDSKSAAEWAERALAAGRRAPALAPRARLVAAWSAWDRDDLPEMERHLDGARSLLERRDTAWRWLQARALADLAGGEAPAAVGRLRLALGQNRKALARFEAAALWNDLGVAGGRAGDLPAAERAFLHALRLYRGCDGPRRTTLALANLAEIRLRRGRPYGVAEILERSTAANRSAGNVRGQAYDAALWARHELMYGRFEAALALCREARALLERHRLDGPRAELAVLAARALGWLGRPAEAAAQLAEGLEAGRSALEAEELPPLLALAGDRERALAAAAQAPVAELWSRLLLDEAVPTETWEALAALGPYRAARAVYDADCLAPGAVPPHWLRRAAAAFRRIGAGPLAGRLEARDAGPWMALAAYLRRPAGEAGALAALFAEAGYRDVRLTLSTPADERLLVPGAGGPERLAAPVAGGELALAAPVVDGPLQALFRIAMRDAPAPAPPSPAGDGLVGDSPALAAALGRVDRLAAGELALLVQGESGTGKELVARRIHRASRRREGPFVAINCAALSESLLLSDLFGHVRGAFTGADRDRAGVFEAAQGGTVFLDEIGDLPPSAQGMLLRVLQEREVRRVGESLPRKVDVRVVAASHRDLATLAQEGAFRPDLYFRLRGGVIALPPLRDRGQDVLRIAEHLLSRRLRAPDGRVLRLSAAAQASLSNHPWPGNVRELENVLGVAVALADGATLEPHHLELPGEEPTHAADYHREVEAFRRRLVERALAAARGNRAEAARRLGVSRQALSYLVSRLRLPAPG